MLKNTKLLYITSLDYFLILYDNVNKRLNAKVLNKGAFVDSMMIKIQECLQKFFRSMIGKILVSQLVLILLPVCLIGLLSFRASERIINRQLIRINTAALDQIEENVSALTSNIYQMVTLYLLDTEIEKNMKLEPSGPLNSLIIARDLENKISNYSLSFDQLRTHTLILGTNGLRFMAKHDLATLTIDDIAKENWYQKLYHAPNHQLWLTVNPGFENIPKDTPVITFIKIMENPQSLHKYGILIFTIEESIFYDLYKNVPDTGSQLYIMNDEGKILTHSHREMTGQTLPPSKVDILLSHCSSEVDNGIFYQGHFITLIKKVHNHWYIVYSIPEANNFHIISRLKTKIIFIVFLCFLFSLMLAIFIAYFFSTPIIDLTQRVTTYLTSASQTEKVKDNTFEFEHLSSEYKIIIKRLDNTIQQLLKEQEEKRKAEFHALQMQINPHFLYNTLNSIKCLVWTNQINLIEPTLTALIKLFKQTVILQDEITIDQEIENIKNYIYIHQIRTGTPIELNCHLSDNLQNCKIPKLILQPIIENAIFHGIEPKNGNGTISLYCSSSMGKIIIEIRDNGIGMDEATITKILHDQNYLNKNSFSGIGLRNIVQRIKLLYGGDFGLTIQSERGVGTLVTLILPEIYDDGVKNV